MVYKLFLLVLLWVKIPKNLEKNEHIRIADECRFKKFVSKFENNFKSKTKDQGANLLLYQKGLFQGMKRNIERIGEAVKDSEYHSLQNFISDSPWDARAVFDQISVEVNTMLLELGGPIGFVIDESSFPKKGRASVGVSWQYSGTSGKTENCQVSVFGAYCSLGRYALADCSLFLPKSWTVDEKRCGRAGVPKGDMAHRSKPELALEMVKRQLALGNRIDFVNGDGLYGNCYALMAGLCALGLIGVFDVHCDQHVYLEEPGITAREGKGGKPPKNTTGARALEVRGIAGQLLGQGGHFRDVDIRKGTKGTIRAKVAVKSVYIWDNKSDHCQKRLLIIRKSLSDDGKEEVRYALSNAEEGRYTHLELAQMQAQRYFVERSFQECKSDLGMAEYQVRGWKAWHHHMAMCMMAQAYVLSEKILHRDGLPLLGAYDIRQVIMETYARKAQGYDGVLAQITYRHIQRDGDKKRRYAKT